MKKQLQKHLSTLSVKIGIIRELSEFLISHKLWWSFPLIFLILFLMLLIVFGGSTGLAPLIYPLF